MRKLVFILMSFLLISCGATKNIPPPNPSVKDSLRVITKIETVFIKDTVLVPVPSQEVRNNTNESSSHLETDFAESDASVDSDGILHHTLRNKDVDVPVATETPVHNKDSIVFSDREVEVPVPYQVDVEVPRELSWFQKTQMIGFWIALVYLVFKYRKNVLAFILRLI